MQGAFCLTAIIAVIAAAAAKTIGLTIRRTENRAEATAAFRFCGRGEHIQRETDVFKITAGVSGDCSRSTGFRHTSAQRVYHHVYSTEQFYDGEKPDADIDCNRSPHSCITVRDCDNVTFAGRMMVVMTRITTVAWISQFGLQSHSFAFCNSEWTAVRITAAIIQISCCGYVCFCGAK